MSTINAFYSALSGIRAAEQQTQKAADGISRFSIEKDDTNLVRDIVDLKTAKHALKANVNVMKAADEMEEQLLDIYA